MNQHIVYIGLGSNLGDGPKNLDKAVALLQKEAGEVLYTSAYIESEPWGFESEHRFTNAVTVINTELEPLLSLTLRSRLSDGWDVHVNAVVAKGIPTGSSTWICLCMITCILRQSVLSSLIRTLPTAILSDFH